MSGLELPTATGVAPWVAWEPLTTGDVLTAGLTAVLGILALTLAAWGLWQMRLASEARNRQLDAQTETLARHGETLAALVRGLETVIERTAPPAPGKADA